MAREIGYPANPFTLLHDGMWKLIDDNPMWDNLVAPRNRIRFTSATDRDPIKQEKDTACYPELWLCPQAGVVNPHYDSCSAMVKYRYQWVLTTADWRSNAILEQCQFAMLCSMVNFKPFIESLTWEGVRFAKRCDAQSFNVGGQDPKKSGGIVGWAAMWQNEIEIHLPRTLLIAAATRAPCP